MLAPFDFHLPTRIVFGPGKLAQVGQEAAAMNKTRAIVVTDAFGTASGLAERVCDHLRAAEVVPVVYDKVQPNPTSTLVDEGAAVAMAHKADIVIGVGGGSSMDAAKGIAVATTHEEKIWPYAIGEAEITARTLPVIAISTTSGTGSQCTCFAVITNPKTHQKPGMGSPFILPRVAIVDPELMVTAPQGLTMNVGFDVFTHAVEAYTSNAASPMSDLFAEKAIRLLARYLPTAYEDGDNLEARGGMALADTYAGIAICHAVVSLAHVIAHVISGRYPEISHGDALYTVYRETLRLNATALPEKHAWIANQLVAGQHDIVRAFDRFWKQFPFENKLKAMALDDDTIAEIAAETFTYMKAITELNPVACDVDDARTILLNSLRD